MLHFRIRIQNLDEGPRIETLEQFIIFYQSSNSFVLDKSKGTGRIRTDPISPISHVNEFRITINVTIDGNSFNTHPALAN